jgi:hypothetical protein
VNRQWVVVGSARCARWAGFGGAGSLGLVRRAWLAEPGALGLSPRACFAEPGSLGLAPRACFADPGSLGSVRWVLDSFDPRTIFPLLQTYVCIILN